MNHPDHLNDPALRDTADRLDALGRLERDEPGPDFEHRLAAATRPGVLASVRPGRDRPVWSSWWGVPIAACLVFGVAGLLFVRAKAPTTPQTDVRLVWNEDDIDDLLYIDGLPDEQTVLDDTSVTDTGDEQTADELLYDLFGLEGGAS